MEFLNRSAIILRAKQPYITWANSLDDGPRYEATIDEPDSQAVFLCPDADSVDDVLEFVGHRFAEFFDYMLEEWCTDRALWPKRRTRAMFREWFRVDVHTLVFETTNRPFEIG